MDAIKNYLESMFASLPNTAEVMKAKSELYQMMEDKYTSLINEGKKENEAIGIVISEFGDLNEIAETLGIENIMRGYEETERRRISLEEAKGYIRDEAYHHFLIGLSVMLFIVSVVGPIIADGLSGSDASIAIGVTMMFVCIAFGVGILIYTGGYMKQWSYIKNSPCTIDYGTADYLYEEMQLNRPIRSLLLTIGVMLIVLCIIPVVILDAISQSYFVSESLGFSLMFIFVGIGVMLIILSSGREKAYKTLLSVNDTGTVSGNYESERGEEGKYNNPYLNSIMPLYWKTVTCIYLIISFLTFSWGTTWIIWPIAAVIHSFLKSMYKEKEA